MTVDWIRPFEIFAVLALSSTCLLYTFVLHLRIHTMVRRGRDERERFERHLAQVAEAAGRWRTEREETARPVPAPAAGQPLNLNKRGQVLRMRRRGEKPETIAAALSMPRNEVDLLLKVHQMSLEQVEKSSAQATG